MTTVWEKLVLITCAIIKQFYHVPHLFLSAVIKHYNRQCESAGAPNGQFSENICSEDDLRSRIFGTFVVRFLACLPLLGFSNI